MTKSILTKKMTKDKTTKKDLNKKKKPPKRKSNNDKVHVIKGKNNSVAYHINYILKSEFVLNLESAIDEEQVPISKLAVGFGVNKANQIANFDISFVQDIYLFFLEAIALKPILVVLLQHIGKPVLFTFHKRFSHRLN